MTIWLVCGGRDYWDRRGVDRALAEREPEAIVHGGAEGADQLAGQWGHENGVPVIEIQAQWLYYGRAAGIRRNAWMLKYVKVDRVLAFPGGRGTENMIRQAEDKGIPVERIE